MNPPPYAIVIQLLTAFFLQGSNHLETIISYLSVILYTPLFKFKDKNKK